MSLGDYFNGAEKLLFAERQVFLGNTLSIVVPSFDVNYPKLLIIVGINDTINNLACTIINTDINANIFATPYLKAQCVPIDYVSHTTILKYDSHIDCSKFIYKTKKEVVEYITKYPEKVLGNVSEDVFKKIVSTITFSKTISTKEKKNYGFL
jgi:hypothetical protein